MTTTSGTHQPVNPWTWQEPYGFAQAVRVDAPQRLLAISGQAAVDDHGAPCCPGDMTGQVEAALDNVEAVLAAAGFSAAEVVQLRLYVTDIGAYYGAQQAFVERFSARGIPVAATLIGVTGLAMPELLVEIDALAVG